jgi:hypothetical protein
MVKIISFNSQISEAKTPILEFRGKSLIRAKSYPGKGQTENSSTFKCLGHDIAVLLT